MTHHIPRRYYRATKSYFPVRWTAPEGVKENRFSSASDVWSFAIVIVEIWQNGRKPYPDKNNRAVRGCLELDPNFMHPNVGCKAELYSLMRDCWKQTPCERPSFAQVLMRLESVDGVLINQSASPSSADPAGDNVLDDEDGYAKPAATIAHERAAATADGDGRGVSYGHDAEEDAAADADGDADAEADGGGYLIPTTTTRTATYVESPVYEFASKDSDQLLQSVSI